METQPTTKTPISIENRLTILAEVAEAEGQVVTAETASEAAAEIERLRSIVELLPKDGDGKPIPPGSVTYCDEQNPFPHTWELRDARGETFKSHCARGRETHYLDRGRAIEESTNQARSAGRPMSLGEAT